jgi:hypothetical protein
VVDQQLADAEPVMAIILSGVWWFAWMQGWI